MFKLRIEERSITPFVVGYIRAEEFIVLRRAVRVSISV